MKRFYCIASLLALLFGANGVNARPTSGPTTLPAGTQPAVAAGEAAKVERRVARLTRQSLELLEAGKIDEADLVIREALALDPRHTINLYNAACIRARQSKPGPAIELLERAAEAGWTDFAHMAVDPDLDSLRSLPEYKALAARKGFFQKQSAERAVAALKKQFGEGYLYEIDEVDKLVFATNIDAPTLAALKTSLTAQARSQWAALFEHKPDDFIFVVVPSLRDYRKIVRMRGVEGFYNEQTNMLVAQRLGQVMTHEFTHALHAADRAPLGQEHPIWLVEGLASFYEASTFEGESLVPHENFRLPLLQNAAKGNKLIPLENLLSMKQPEFIEKANLAYGQASSVMLYLYDKGLLRKFYDAYKAGYDHDTTGRAALERVSGQKLPEFEAAWVAWMKKRVPPPTYSGPDGPVLGASLDGGIDGLRLTRMIAKGPAEQAGLQVGDVLVEIDGRAVRDYPSFGPAMALYKPGQKVLLKIRRQGEYIDVPITLGRRADLVSPSPTGSPRRPGPDTRPIKGKT